MSGSRFLIVRWSAIGDCVMAVPVPSVIRRSRPDSTIAWAVEDRCAAVVDTDELIDYRLEAPRQAWKRGRWSPRTWRSQMSYYAGLRKMRFDFGVDLQGHLKTALCLRIAKPRKGVSVGATDVLARRLSPIATIPNECVHTVERNLAALRSLGQFGDDESPIMPRIEAERRWVRDFFPSNQRIASIAVSAGSPAKALPLDTVRTVARRLTAEGFEVALLGGAGDPDPEVAATTNWIGKLQLRDTMAAVAESTVHVCGDTGTGHLAAAYGVPVVSVFGPTDPAKYRPYTVRSVVLREGVTTTSVHPDQIVEAVDRLLERHGREIPH